jgi:hypothetical protein
LDKLTGRATKICFDDFRSEPIAIEEGLDQGCALLVILYNIYNSAALEVPKEGRAMDEAGLLKANGPKPLGTRETTDKEWAKRRAESKEDEVKVFTDGSGYGGEIGAAAVRVRRCSVYWS